MSHHLPAEILALAETDRAALLEEVMVIDTKHHERVHLRLWPHQRWVMSRLKSMNIVVKPRQVGFTTILSLADFLDVLLYPPMHMAIVSHEAEATSRLLNRIRVAYESLPDWIRPAISHDSTHEMSFPEIGSGIYIGTAGCLHPDSQVLTEGGNLKRIAEIVPGADKVYVGRGRHLSTVEQVTARDYRGKMLKITASGNPSTPLTVTPDHKFMLHKRWRTAADIVSPLNARGRRVCYFIRPITDRVRDIGGIQVGYSLGWVFGLYLAEGWYGGAYTSFGLNIKEDKYRERLETFAEENGCTFRWRATKGKGMEVSLGSASFMKTIATVFGKEKNVPDWFWECGKEFLNGVIDGYVAGDGYRGPIRTKVTSVRPHLLYQLRDMLLSAREVYSAIYKGKARISFGHVGKVPWTLEFPQTRGIRFHHYRKSSLSKYSYRYVSIPIKWKEVEFSGLVYDLSCGGSFSTPACLVHNSRAFGRGDVFHRIILSEFAQWEPNQCHLIRVGITESCPVLAGGRITIESTPNGEGNEHHQLYVGAKAGTNSYTPIFLPHFMHPEYYLSEGNEIARLVDRGQFEPTVEEQALMQQWVVGLDRIRWRRWAISKFGYSEQLNRALFLQEYPEDDISCFRSVAEGVFSLEHLARMELEAKEPSWVDAYGLRWWAKPLAERSYVVGVDPSEGIGEDRTAALVLDITDYPFVTHIATLRGKFRDDETASLVAEAGKAAGVAPLVVELNSVGQSVLNSLVNRLHYPRLYYQRDPLTGLDKSVPGFRTTSPSKRILLTEGLKVVNGGYLRTFDAELIKELRTFRRYPDGSMSAAPGSHDDFVMALLLGLQAAATSPRRFAKGHRSQRYGIFG